MPPAMYAEPKGPLSSTTLALSTSWYQPLRELLNLTSSPVAPTAEQREAALFKLISGFVTDLECGVVYSASEHMATQMSFLTSGLVDRAHFDFQIRMQNLSADLERLGQQIEYSSALRRNGSVWKCALGRENEAGKKAKMPISKADFEGALTRHAGLVQRLCTVYMQDYVCLGFTLPLECEGGGELSWMLPLEKRTHRKAGTSTSKGRSDRRS
uniref:Uncharacterized protein n=1 Tax=Calcidiscus leptoporus TaxID=127549 RepID=A0A7S0P0U9_9EUKA|mmetsp:Transcript_47100/g.109318  ORF Transcript_47100/g.109318 Transcript_47100/m.109318 type:complete len:213 (+) Transcript_47100:207-845(+)